MTESEKERIKLSANYLNGIAIALFAVGAVSPTVSSLDGGSAPTAPVVIATVICIVASAGLHYVARVILKGLKP